jgi:hypothetical protein
MIGFFALCQGYNPHMEFREAIDEQGAIEFLSENGVSIVYSWQRAKGSYHSDLFLKFVR